MINKLINNKLRGLMFGMFLISSFLVPRNIGAANIGSEFGTEQNKTIIVTPDTMRLIRNPLNGWVLYATTGVSTDFWEKYDRMKMSDGRVINVCNYVNTLYIRTSWSKLNPQEDVYGWNTDPVLKMLIKGARERGMRLAFRVVVDSRDKTYDFTPDFVREAGTKGFVTRGRWSPYPDDPIFQKYYEKFVYALAHDFSNPDEVDFIDGTGLGKWGEYHTTLYSTGDNGPRQAVLDWVSDLYLKAFKNIPIIINYHRFVGAGKDWDNNLVDENSEYLLDRVVAKGYSLRHDAFGMGLYYGDWERNFAKKYFGIRPILMEGGWITKNHHSYWVDPKKYRKGHPEDVRIGEFEDSKEARVNTMDFRYGDTDSWFEEKTFPLVQRFISEGGYRLYPDRISVPVRFSKGSTVTLTHRWVNMGWGYCPTNIPQWKGRFKVAFALLDKKTELPKYVFTDEQAEASEWLKGNPKDYIFSLNISDIKAGNYVWAIGIVDTLKDYGIGIQIAAKDNLTNEGWLKLSEVKVK